MKKLTILIPLLMFLVGCNSAIKNTDATVEEEAGTELVEGEVPPTPEQVIEKTVADSDANNAQADEIDPIGFWVGYFKKEKDMKSESTVYVDEGYIWNRENKINISIDEMGDSTVKGHSVVAGNDRPFYGTFKKVTDGLGQLVGYSFEVKEPGDNKYDGEFNFQITNNQLTGKWVAYKDIEVKNRKYTLEKKTFQYNPNISLEQAKQYVNWEKALEHTIIREFDEGDTEEWISKEFATATDNIYKINASSQLLTKPDVENLKKGDLTIIRNTIYARHGYSFKNRPLRVFFDAQNWYIPVHTDIRADFTEIEKKNIQLLLSFEKNAAEYYDSFGRG